MQDKFVSAINEQTGKNFSQSAIFNNLIADVNANPNTADELPIYRAGDNFSVYGDAFTSNPKTFFNYMDQVAIKYGLVFMKTALARDPLKILHRGLIPYGGKIESIIADIVKPKAYRPDLSDTESPFQIMVGRVVAHTYTETYDVESGITIMDTQDNMHFQNLSQFNNFVFARMMSVVNGIISDRFNHEKLGLATTIADGKMGFVKATSMKDFQTKVLKWSREMQYFTDNMNADGVTQATPVEDLVIIMGKDYSVQLDVDFFANVFNAEITQSDVTKIEIDRFPDVWKYSADHTVTSDDINNNWVSAREHAIGTVLPKGSLARPNAKDAIQVLDGSKVGAIIMDRDAYQIYEQLPLTLSTENNPRKRYVNIFGNEKDFFMFVQSLNSLAIMADGIDINQTSSAEIETINFAQLVENTEDTETPTEETTNVPEKSETLQEATKTLKAKSTRKTTKK